MTLIRLVRPSYYYQLLVIDFLTHVKQLLFICYTLFNYSTGSSNTLLPSVLSELCGTGNIARLQAVTNSFGALPILLMPPFSGE